MVKLMNKSPCSLCGSRDWPNEYSPCPQCKPSEWVSNEEDQDHPDENREDFDYD
jgi:hypothetical protein